MWIQYHRAKDRIVAIPIVLDLGHGHKLRPQLPMLRSWRLPGILFLLLALGVMGDFGIAKGNARKPLPLEKAPELYQRIITLPNASLFQKADKQSNIIEEQIPTFEVFYVYDRKSDWIEVGRSVQGRADGWIEKALTQDWSIMLVMQYAPPGQRERVLFFEDVDPLIDLVASPRVSRKAQALLKRVDQGQHSGTGLMAVEALQEGFVSFEGNPYLMPILGARREMYDDGTNTVLVEIASVSAAEERPAPKIEEAPIAEAQRAIVFVIDTTTSMGPYIEQALETARRIHQEVGQSGLLDRTSFGLVGYRNNMDKEPQRSKLEYVSRIYQELNPATPPDKILNSLDRMRPATVSTHSWNEDAVAGLYDALWQMNWDPYDELRLILLMTDAGALSATDPKAKHHADMIDLWNIRQKANQDSIAIIPIHLLTPEAEQAGNIASARQQYLELGKTGDTNLRKYISIEAGSVELFAKQFDQFAGELVAVVKRASQGIAESKVTIASSAERSSLGALFRNEAYSAQQRYLGEVRGAEATVFYRAWASDKDLTQPKRTSLDVGVFLTRNQLNALAQSLSALVERGMRAQEAPETFFALLRSLAVEFSTDPKRHEGGYSSAAGFSTIAESKLMPTYLKLLPYKSDIMKLTEDMWLDLGPTGQDQLMSKLQKKLRAYHDINADERKWKDLGTRDSGSEVFPISFQLLP